MYHKHHKIPKHAGGTNEPENLILLTVSEHAEAHRILFEEYGRWQDKIAWEMLSGQINKETAMREAQKLGRLGYKASDASKEKMRAAKLGKPQSKRSY